MVPSSSFGFSVQRYKKITYDKKNWLLKNKRLCVRTGSERKNTCVKSYAFHAPQEVYDILENMPGSKSNYINKFIILATKMGIK